MQLSHTWPLIPAIRILDSFLSLPHKEQRIVVSFAILIDYQIYDYSVFQKNHINPSSNWATSLIISFSQGGSKVSFSSAVLIPDSSFSLFSTSAGKLSATGQLGEVSVITIFRLFSSS